MEPKDVLSTPACKGDLLEFKRVMHRSILDSGIPKKNIAVDLGCSDSSLSHWLSESAEFSMPGHLVPLFCKIVGDDALLWHLREKTGGAQ